MDRVSSAGYQTISGRRTWQNMNLGSGIQGTTFDQVFFAGVQESVIGPIEKSGQTPTDSTLGATDTQLLNAILAFAGANVQDVNSTPGAALPALSAGLVVVNATSGNISMTLPASSGLGGEVQRWKFARTDGTSNTVSIAFHAGDTTLLGGASGPLSLGPTSVLDLVGDGTTHWLLSNTNLYSGIYADTGSANAMAVTLSPAPASLAAILGIPFLVQKSASASTGALTLAVNGLTATTEELSDGTAFSSSVVWPASALGQVVYDGTVFRVLTVLNPGSLNQSHGEMELSSSGSWTAPAGVTSITGDFAAPGGGGGFGANASSGGGGGGGGQCVRNQTLTVVPGTVYTITLGAPGAGGTSGSVDGTAGGTSTFGALLTLSGGQGGHGAGTGGAAGGAGGLAGLNGAVTAASVSFGGHGGGSLLGTGAPGGMAAMRGVSGTAPGVGGGGGAGGSSNGGDGGASVFKWWW